MSYTYKNGQQPLAGYTIKRGVGRGGFGEVYFAVSDSGKEVALKLLKGRSDVELRGVAHCLNLKHPNLVHIYDQKVDDQGNPWIVMEYVLGESLADVLDRHPQGLPMHLAKDWFLSLSRAVGFLHDHGVLHRDLKPANVFIENGTVKVGDYGLCKSIGSPSERQTRNVGTVHYMAPEVGNGQYGRSVDIYACAAILYEMLVGRPPFDGDSDAEVLIKHTTEAPNLANVPTPFREVVARGLCKDPVQRYATMTEFARAVDSVPFGNAAAASPPPLPNPIPNPLPSVPTGFATSPPNGPPIKAKVIASGPPVARRIANDAAVASVPLPMSSDINTIPKLDPKPVSPFAKVSFRQSLADLTSGIFKASILSAIGILPWALFSQTSDIATIGKVYLTTLSIVTGVLVLSFRTSAKNQHEWPIRIRMAMLGLVVGCFTFWLDGRTMPTTIGNQDELLVGTNTYVFGQFHASRADANTLLYYVAYFSACLGLCRWWKMAALDRKESWTLFNPIAAGFFGCMLSFLWPHEAGYNFDHGIVPLLIASVAVPLASAWTPPPPPLPRKLRA
ncbi:MAG: serine/threonine-protein kinase [Gemmataceae bacterium]